MKRSSPSFSSSPSPEIQTPSPPPGDEGDEEFKPSISPSPPSKKHRASPKQPAKTKSKVAKTPTKDKVKTGRESGRGGVDQNGNGNGNGTWTPELREKFIDKILELGYKAANLKELAKELGMKEKQLVNQLTPGRKGSFRDKCVKHIRGD